MVSFNDAERISEALVTGSVGTVFSASELAGAAGVSVAVAEEYLCSHGVEYRVIQTAGCRVWEEKEAWELPEDC